MRRGLTMVELMVALGVAAVAGLAVYQTVLVFVGGERSTDREATRSIAEARMMEILMKDIRSAVEVTEGGPQDYTVHRNVLESGRVVEKNVRWRVDGKARVIREVAGESPQQFDFSGMLAADEPVFRFRMERLRDQDVTFGR